MSAMDIGNIISAIEANCRAAELAHIHGDEGAIGTSLGELEELVAPLERGARLKEKLRQLLAGKSRGISRGDLDVVLQQIRTDVERLRRSARIHGTARPYLLQLAPDHRPYVPRPDQTYIAKRAGIHFTTVNEREGEVPKRGLFREDTGMGKSLTYGFCIREMRRVRPEIFKDAVVVMASHQAEPAYDLAQQTKALFPQEKVVFITGELKPEELKGATFVTGTYQQLAQSGTIDLLKAWAGRRRVLFVLDEADMVAFKGLKDYESGEWNENAWDARWMRPFIEFGLFNEEGKYNPKTQHYMLGASATLDRPDGIPLSTVWGPGNVFYHTPMAEGVRKGHLVPVVGYAVEMEVPPDAEMKQLKYFVQIRDGKPVVDQSRVAETAGTDYAVKQSVRSAVDHILMEIGVGDRKAKAVRQGIGYAPDRNILLKTLRWHQDLFDLMEVIFLVCQGLASKSPMRVETILAHLGGKQNLENFGPELRRFLYYREWVKVQPLFKRAAESLKKENKEGVAELFTLLYLILNVEARKIKGSRLIATAAWQGMEEGERRRIVRRDSFKDRGPVTFPNQRWPNRYGDRQQTMGDLQKGQIDFLWGIGMLERGFNVPMISLIVDNALSNSRRQVVQRAGREMRPPSGRNPTDHSRKPDAVYVSIVPNLKAHQLDLSKMDLARIFGNQMNPELNVFHVTRGGDMDVPTTPDTVQLELKEEGKVHLVRVGANTAKAVLNFLKRKYEKDFDMDVAAYDALISTDRLQQLLMAIRFPKEKELKEWLHHWGAADQEVRDIMAVFHSDVADMKTVYGGFWRIISQEGGKR